MQPSRTQYKLEEAKFFLLLLEQNWRHFPHVDYFLSAFVSAARSVTWVMRSEYGSRPGWEDWYKNKKPKNELREVLKRMNDLRVRATKTIPVKTRTTATVTIPRDQITPELQHFFSGGAKGQIRLEPTNPTNTEALVMIGDRVLAKARLDHAIHELPEFPGRDAKDVCREYLNDLESLCNECDSRYRA